MCACIQHLPAANEWQPTSPAGLAVLGYGAGAGCFLMVITHFVLGWIILHWHCLGPRGEPHKVDPASQRATKTQMQQRHPTPGLRSSTHTRTRRRTQKCTHTHWHTLISYSQFQQRGLESLKWAACADADTVIHIHTCTCCPYKQKQAAVHFNAFTTILKERLIGILQAS